MTYVVAVSAEAENDLRRIYEYIAFELQSPDAAFGQLERLEKAILALDKVPYRFPEYDNKKWKQRKLRMMPVDNYCIFYIPDDETETVTITRILYGARDIPAVLKDNDI